MCARGGLCAVGHVCVCGGACGAGTLTDHYYAALAGSRWLDNLSHVLTAATRIAEFVHKRNTSVIVHCMPSPSRGAHDTTHDMTHETTHGTTHGTHMTHTVAWLTCCVFGQARTGGTGRRS